MSEMNNRRPAFKEPMFNVGEPAPLLVAIILVLCHLGYVLAPQSLKEVIFAATFLGASEGNVLLSGRPLGNIATLFTHTLKHADWAHVLMNAGFIWIFGVLTIRATKNVEIPVFNRIKRGPIVFLTIFLAGALLGALAQWIVWIAFGQSAISVGASTGGAALFAAAGWAIGGKERMLGFIIVVMAIDAVVVLGGGSQRGMHDPAWLGHFGGLMAGALLAPKLLYPGGAHLNRFR